MLQMYTNPVSFIGYLYRIAIHLLCACWCQDTWSVYNNHMMMLSMVYCAIGTYPITQWITFLWRFILAYKCRLRPQKLYTSACPSPVTKFQHPCKRMSTIYCIAWSFFSLQQAKTCNRLKVQPGARRSGFHRRWEWLVAWWAPLISKELLNVFFVQPPRSQASTPSSCRLQYEKRGAAEIYYRR